MKIPLLGGYSKRRSVNQDAQRTVNLYLETDTAEPESGSALYMVPGKTEFAAIGNGPIRAMINHNHLVIAISGNEVYRINETGAGTRIGTITLGGTKRVALSANRNHVIAVTGQNAYIITGSSVTAVTDTDFAGSYLVDYLDGYFVFAIPGSQQFYISAINDGSSFDALDFAQAESNLDDIVGLIVDHRELWLFGSQSIEIWYNSGATDFPLARRDGAVLEVGCAAPQSISKADNTIFWLGRNAHGQGLVYRADQYNPQIISNRGIEYEIGQMPDIEKATAFSYQQSGHTFYVLSFPESMRTYVYDASIQDPELAWHVRETYAQGRDRANCHVFAFGKHLVGDYASNQVWELSDTTYTDGGLPICWERTTPRIVQDYKRVMFRSLTINMERGVGLVSGHGSDPSIYLDWSDDGGHTWCSKRSESMGKIGAFKPSITFNRLGCSRDRVFRITGSCPVKTVILGAYLDAEAGDH